LKVFVTALAIVDDILAVLVIGLFYTANLDLRWLAVAAAALGLLGLANRLGVARLDVYAVLAVGLWLAVLQSGIHATLAGVMAAMTIPARARRTPDEALATVAAVLPRPGSDAAAPAPAGDPDPEEALRRVRAAAEAADAPLERLEHTLHPWTAFAIVPLFALANAGVTIGDHLAATVASPVAYGIVAGLVVGKQVGILSATWLAVRSGLASLPSGVSWLHVWGGSWAAGIGFTMSLFIAELAFPGQVRLEVAKLGILAASVTAATGGAVVLGLGGRRRRTGGPS
jgi:NhaA family Na+:H+ antiporter